MKKLIVGLLVCVCASLAFAAPVEIELVPKAWTGFCNEIEVDGQTGWQTERWKTLGSRYFFFDVKDPAYKNGKAPELEVALTYFDTVAAPITLQYDSTDSSANKEGAFKPGKTFRSKGRGGLKTVSWTVTDAKFANRLGANDFRIAIGKNVDFIIKEVVVRTAGGRAASAPATVAEKKMKGFAVAEEFSSDMMLPSDVMVPVWGVAPDGTIVTVSFNGYDLECTASEGKWSVIFPPMDSSSEPREMTIQSSGHSAIRYSNVLVGDSGKSLEGYKGFL